MIHVHAAAVKNINSAADAEKRGKKNSGRNSMITYHGFLRDSFFVLRKTVICRAMCFPVSHF